MLEESPNIKRMTLSQMIPQASELAIDLISKLLTYDPAKRLTSLEALQHPFFKDFYDPETDKSLNSGTPIKYYDFEFEQYKMNKDIIKELILDEIILQHSYEAR